MDTKAAIVALLSVWGVGTCSTLPAMAEDQDIVREGEEAADNLLVNRVWLRQGDDSGLPGSAQIFLADGTLVSDSCWETYRLSRWQQLSDTTISWEEDGVTISADISSLNPDELVLALKMGDEVTQQRFTPAAVPYVCPDMPKS